MTTMAPKGGTPTKKDALYIHQIERTPEYDDFIKRLIAFHEKRGTSFEPEPRLPTMHGHVHVDLYRLYKTVIEKGGYDEVCKIQKAWGALANELGMYYDDSKGMGQLSFQLKQDFYRYLAAFWVQDQHGQEPPPKEILEAQSCASKHGPVLGRTLESFKLANKRPEAETPTKEERPGESTPGSSNRSSGRLREAPPQRVPFQPETGPTRQTRQASSQNATPTSSQTHPAHPQQPQQPQHHMTPQHQHHQHPQHPPSSANPLHIIQAQQAALRGASSTYTPPLSESASRLPEAFEPRPPISVALRPVTTPGNNPVEYTKRQRLLRQGPPPPPDPSGFTRPAIPGVGFEGPNIYTRCLQALRSDLPDEQSFALNHLVKISFERGDKYKFDSFLGLAEGLIEKALEIGSLFYHVEWQVTYSFGPNDAIGALDGLNGTNDIIRRIGQLEPKRILDFLQPAEFSNRLLRITEAVLTIRNMVMLIENAIYMADVYPLKDLLCIILHLPNLETLVEVKHFALDVAEQVTPWLEMDSDDPLYQTLLLQLDSTDRGIILTSLRSVSRISMNLEATNTLQNVPAPILQNIMDWLLLNDEELVDACLDFLYQYTAVVSNVESLLKSVDMERVVPHLVRLLAHGAKRVKEDWVLQPEHKLPASEEVVQLPPDLLEKLCDVEEPQRSFQWLQSLFEEDSQSHITQIAIWQAYQGSFGSLKGNKVMLSAADFIRNVSSVFSNARAQIIRGPGEAQRFIIEGIRARSAPMDPASKLEYSRCLWATRKSNSPEKCNSFFLSGQKMWHHILTRHVGVKLTEEGKVEDRQTEATCDWEGCTRFVKPTNKKLSEFSSHIKTHVPSLHKRSLSDMSESLAKRPKRSYVVPAKTMSLTWEQTLATRDERNPRTESAAGIPLSAVLVLRNLARNVVKTEAEEELLKRQEMRGESGGWNEKLFRPVMIRLFEVMTENKAMADYITSLLQLVQDD